MRLSLDAVLFAFVLFHDQLSQKNRSWLLINFAPCKTAIVGLGARFDGQFRNQLRPTTVQLNENPCKLREITRQPTVIDKSEQRDITKTPLCKSTAEIEAKRKIKRRSSVG